MSNRTIQPVLITTCAFALGLPACKADTTSRDPSADDHRGPDQAGYNAEHRDDEQAEVDPDRGERADLERFELIERESREEFARRANERLAGLEREIQGITPAVSASSSADAQEELDKARKAVEEARRDLDEVRQQSADVIDDGRMGVMVAINRAQRALEDAREDLGQTAP